VVSRSGQRQTEPQTEPSQSRFATPVPKKDDIVGEMSGALRERGGRLSRSLVYGIIYVLRNGHMQSVVLGLGRYRVQSS
jgi:hypothetical protein